MKKELFIDPQNQTLLWEIIHTCPYISRITNPEEWFQTHIEQVYESPIQFGSLYQYNQKAIQNMLADMKQIADYEKEEQEKATKEDIKRQQMQQWVDKDTLLKTDVSKDKPIRNMEELLAEQQKMRASDIPDFPKPQGESIQ